LHCLLDPEADNGRHFTSVRGGFPFSRT
jgi:hypothetical protein